MEKSNDTQQQVQFNKQNEPTSTISSANKKMLIVLSVVILCMIIGGGGYYIGKSLSTSNPQKAIVPSLQPHITPAHSTLDTEYMKAEEERKAFLHKSLALDGANYVTILGTDLELQIPAAYEAQKLEQDNMLNDTMLLNYKSVLPSALQAKLTNPGDWWGDFRVGIIQTSLTPQNWVLDNVLNQGVKLRDEPESVSKGTTVTINGQQFFIINTGCCSADYFVYLLPYINMNGQKSILAFTTHNRVGSEDTKRQKNVILDTILSTLRKK